MLIDGRVLCLADLILTFRQNFYLLSQFLESLARILKYFFGFRKAEPYNMLVRVVRIKRGNWNHCNPMFARNPPGKFLVTQFRNPSVRSQYKVGAATW